MTFEFEYTDSIFNVVYTKNKEEYAWTPWIGLQNEMNSNKNLLFHELIIPTKDTMRISHLLDMLVYCNKHVLFSGPTGTSKTITILN